MNPDNPIIPPSADGRCLTEREDGGIRSHPNDDILDLMDNGYRPVNDGLDPVNYSSCWVRR